MNEQDNRHEPIGDNGSNSPLNEGDIIEMIDENGETVPFVFIDAVEYNEDLYLALAEPEEDDAVFFLKIDTDESGNDVYTAPDEALEDILFEIFSSGRSQDSSDE